EDRPRGYGLNTDITESRHLGGHELGRLGGLGNSPSVRSAFGIAGVLRADSPVRLSVLPGDLRRDLLAGARMGVGSRPSPLEPAQPAGRGVSIHCRSPGAPLASDGGTCGVP